MEERRLEVPEPMTEDSRSEDLKELAGKHLHKLYVYELHSKEEIYGFIQPLTATVASVDTNFEKHADQHNLLKDDNGWHFEAVLEAVENEELDSVNGTSLTGQTLSKELACSAISNQKINVEHFNSLLVTIDTPLDVNKYNNNQQDVYLIAKTSSTELADYEKGTENLYSVFTLANLKLLEAQATNCKILLSDVPDLKLSLFETPADYAAASLTIDNTALIDSIKAEGVEYTKAPEVLLKEKQLFQAHHTYGNRINVLVAEKQLEDIDDSKFPIRILGYYSKPGDATEYKLFDRTIHTRQDLTVHTYDNGQEKVWFDVYSINITKKTRTDVQFNAQRFAPIKMTPTGIKDKVTMTCEWFDESKALPFETIEKFKGGKGLWEIITNTDDLHLIEDMIAMAYLIVSQFEDLPIITDKTNINVGKFDPQYGIGHSAMPVSRTEGKGLELLDGLYETHVRKHPSFESDIQRKKLVDGIINALCRYIFTTYTIATGNSTYGWAYLPWFLVPFDTAGSTLTGISLKQVDPPSGATAGITKTYVLDSTIKWFPKTLYFNHLFTQESMAQVGDLMDDLHAAAYAWRNTGNKISVQTDRRMTLPEVPYQLSEMTVPGVTGAVDINSEDGLSYIWKIPVINPNDYKKIMVGGPVVGKKPIGTSFKFEIPKPAEATIFRDDAEKEDYIRAWIATKLRINLSQIQSVTIPSVNAEASDLKRLGADWYIVPGARERTNELPGDWSDQPRVSGNYLIDKWTLAFAAWAQQNQKWGRNQKLHDLIADDFTTDNLITPGREQRQLMLKYIADTLVAYKVDATGRHFKPFYENPTSWADVEAQVSKRIRIISSTWDLFTYDQSGTAQDVVGTKGEIRFEILTDTFTGPTDVVLTVAVGADHTFTERQIEFDKTTWEEYVDKTIGAGKIKFDLKSQNKRPIDEIDRLTITSMWANEFTISNAYNGVSVTIPAMNKFDESITTQHILFV